MDISFDPASPDVAFVPELPSQPLVANTHTSVLVMVRHPAGMGVQISMSGERGLTSLPIKDETGQGSTRARSKDEAPKVTPPVITSHSFAPRKPGNADIRVQIFDNSGTPVFSEELVEIIVEQTYAGALRIGISLVAGGALDRAYEARAVGGSGQAQVLLKDGSTVQPELVVGFAPFIFEALWGGGRGYSGNESKWRKILRIAPYVGLGVLTNSPNGIDGFKSFYFGAEWEPAPSFSVALTGVVRRVTRLSPGTEVGSAVADGNVPTQTQHDIGWGVVINVTPGFLRIANLPGSSFFK